VINLITPRALFSPIFLQVHSFEIFQDDVRPPLGFGSTGSRSIQYANPENYISTNM